MKTILIVEDNELVAKNLRSILEDIDSSLQIYETAYAEKAYVYASENKIDVFIFDIQLLDYSGVELAEKIRMIDSYKMTPIIFISSDYGAELHAYRSSHCYSFINKPYKSADVKKVLSTVLEHGVNKSVDNRKFSIKYKGHIVSLLQKDILYVESVNRKIHIVTEHETISLSKRTLSDIMEQFTSSFIQCHRSFIVNTEWIYMINKVEKIIKLRHNKGEIPYGSKFINDIEGRIQ